MAECSCYWMFHPDSLFWLKHSSLNCQRYHLLTVYSCVSWPQGTTSLKVKVPPWESQQSTTNSYRGTKASLLQFGTTLKGHSSSRAPYRFHWYLICIVYQLLALPNPLSHFLSHAFLETSSKKPFTCNSASQNLFPKQPNLRLINTCIMQKQQYTVVLLTSSYLCLGLPLKIWIY